MDMTKTAALIPDGALKKHIAILGANGSGKTSVAKSQVVEPALAARRAGLLRGPDWRYVGCPPRSRWQG